MRQCTYCKIQDTRSCDVLFFEFPKNKDQLDLWLKNMGYSLNWRPLKTSYLCSEHFTKDSVDLEKKVLLQGCVPTIFERHMTSLVLINKHDQIINKIIDQSPVSNVDTKSVKRSLRISKSTAINKRIRFNNTKMTKNAAHPKVPLDFNSPATLRVCRICLDIDVKMYNLSKHNLSSMYEQTMGVRIDAEDKLPQMLCWECTARLSSASHFIKKALKTQRILLAELDGDDVITIGDVKSINRTKTQLKSTLGFDKPNDLDVYFNEDIKEENTDEIFVDNFIPDSKFKDYEVEICNSKEFAMERTTNFASIRESSIFIQEDLEIKDENNEGNVVFSHDDPISNEDELVNNENKIKISCSELPGVITIYSEKEVSMNKEKTVKKAKKPEKNILKPIRKGTDIKEERVRVKDVNQPTTVSRKTKDEVISQNNGRAIGKDKLNNKANKIKISHKKQPVRNINLRKNERIRSKHVKQRIKGIKKNAKKLFRITEKSRIIPHKKAENIEDNQYAVKNEETTIEENINKEEMINKENEVEIFYTDHPEIIIINIDRKNPINQANVNIKEEEIIKGNNSVNKIIDVNNEDCHELHTEISRKLPQLQLNDSQQEMYNFAKELLIKNKDVVHYESMDVGNEEIIDDEEEVDNEEIVTYDETFNNEEGMNNTEELTENEKEIEIFCTENSEIMYINNVEKLGKKKRTCANEDTIKNIKEIEKIKRRKFDNGERVKVEVINNEFLSKLVYNDNDSQFNDSETNIFNFNEPTDVNDQEEMSNEELLDKHNNTEVFYTEYPELLEVKHDKEERKKNSNKKLKIKKVKEKIKDTKLLEKNHSPTTVMEKYKKSDVDSPKTQELNDFIERKLTYVEQIDEVQSRKESAEFKKASLKCDICYKGFNMQDAYDNHIVKHSIEMGSFECFICKIRFMSNLALKKHLGSVHVRRFYCKRCSFVTNQRAIAQNHSAWHEGKKYKCKHCSRQFDKLTTYQGHLRLKHVSDFVCELCGRTFVSARGIQMHKHSTHKFVDENVILEGPYCELCDVKFISEEAYLRHMKRSAKHTSNSQLANESNEKGFSNPKFPCELCGTQINRDSYVQHYRVNHPDTSTLMCEQCGKMFNSLLLFKNHKCLYLEVGSKQVVCDKCGLIFEKKIHLYIHRNRVHNDKGYKCKICDKYFLTADHRHRHTKYMHANHKPFQCDICDKFYKSSSNLRAHVNHVHMNVPWPKRDRKRNE